jgi:hypothetical protein
VAKKEYFPIYPDLWDADEMFHLATTWRIDVYEKAQEVDPFSESKWGDLAMGYALGKGLSPDQACDFELFVSHLGIR